jgi:hypothetical protein
MFVRQKEGFFELELGDWKDNRLFRILAVDQGQLSFSDETFDSDDANDAVIVVTNPTDVRFSTPPNSVDVVKTSTHIRVLVFSSRSVVKVSASIDDNDVFECQQVTADHPLYVAEWNPAKYVDGTLHSLRIDVEIKSADEKTFKRSRNIQVSMP